MTFGGATNGTAQVSATRTETVTRQSRSVHPRRGPSIHNYIPGPATNPFVQGGSGSRAGNGSRAVSGGGLPTVVPLPQRLQSYSAEQRIVGACVATATNPCGFEEFNVAAPPPAAAPNPAAPAAAPGQPAPADGAAPTPAPVIDVVTIVNAAVANLQLPAPEPHLGPEPDVNEWKMLAVGLPVWIWTNTPAQIDASTTQQGIPITLTAHLVRTEISLGDGTTLSCKTATPRPAYAEPMAESPDCGHTWLTAGTYDVTATNIWAVEWAALGQAGLVTMERSASRTVEVGQLASVVTR